MPKKRKCKKWPFLDLNHGLAPLEKCHFFDFLNFLLLWPRKAFSVLEYQKRHFPCPYCLKKKVKKWPFLDQNHGLTPLENVNFSTFWTSCFYSLERRFFVLEYHKRHFPGIYCLKKKVRKMAIFGPKPWVQMFGKLWISRLFKLLVFIF